MRWRFLCAGESERRLREAFATAAKAAAAGRPVVIFLDEASTPLGAVLHSGSHAAQCLRHLLWTRCWIDTLVSVLMGACQT